LALIFFKGPTMPRKAHDAPYKLLFSSPRMVAELIRGFVPDEWLAQFDATTLTPVPTNMINPRMQQLHGDMVWRFAAPDQNGEVFVHIEFQSQPRKDMPLRMMEYMANILKAWMRTTKPPPLAEWPPVLSIVIYTGKPRWKGSHLLSENIRRMPHGWLRDSTEHRFVLVDIHRQKVVKIDKLENLVALVMQLELVRRTEDVAAVLAQLNQKIPQQDPLREIIRDWAMAITGDSSSIAPLFDQFVNTKGTDMSFKENVEAMFAERDRAAHAQGQAEILARQINRRFGQVDEATQIKLSNAKPDMLQNWADAILTAKTLDEVFAAKH
jgi:hypothetical protein